MIAAFIALALVQSAASAGAVGESDQRIRTASLPRVSYVESTPLAGNRELARRGLTPLQAAQLPALLTARKARLAEQPVEVSQEQFGEHVPPKPLADGRYGLFVFVPPWQSPDVPADWLPELDAAGLITVSAARQGNAESPLGRREPLAVLAAFNAMQRHPINPDRVFVGGFSGGSKVALKLALSYPDLFRGALLDAGAYPIGDTALPIPPADLFERFRQSSRIVLIAGDHDTAKDEQQAGIASLQSWCVAHANQMLVPGLGHEPVSRSDFRHALAGLVDEPRPSSRSLALCWQRRLNAREAALKAVRDLSSSGKAVEARRRLITLDREYGGLAAPESQLLEQQLAPATR